MKARVGVFMKTSALVDYDRGKKNRGVWVLVGRC